MELDKSQMLSACIGAFFALLVSFISNRRNSKNEKKQLISELIGYLLNQKRYAKRFVGHKIWLNYYFRLNLLANKEHIALINEKIENRLKYIEEIELRFIDCETRLTMLASQYRTFYPKDVEFSNLINEIKEYTITRNIDIPNFVTWSKKEINNPEINTKINNIIEDTISQLSKSLFPIIDSLMSKLEQRI